MYCTCFKQGSVVWSSVCEEGGQGALFIVPLTYSCWGKIDSDIYITWRESLIWLLHTKHTL